MADTLLARLFLDAQEEFLRAIDHVPAPGRGGPIGHLNAPGWIVAHLACSHDAWVQRFSAGRDMDPWTAETLPRISAQVREGGPPLAFSLDETREVFARVAARAEEWIDGAPWDVLAGPADLAGTPFEAVPTSRAYMVARAIAHLYVHAGELTVIASLMAAGDLGLPGPLPRSSAPTAEDDPSIPVIGALLRDGYVEMDRAAAVTPRPAAEGAMDRLASVAETLVHVAGREDRLWNVRVQGRGPSSLLASVDPAEVSWDSARDALTDVTAAAHPWLEGLDAPAAAAPMEWRGEPSSVGAQVARSAGHCFSHAGEMMAHASLFGVADIGMPGQLAHVAAAAPPRG